MEKPQKIVNTQSPEEWKLTYDSITWIKRQQRKVGRAKELVAILCNTKLTENEIEELKELIKGESK